MKKFLLLIPFLSVFFFISCGQKTNFTNVEEIPLPPEAAAGKIDGRLETQLAPAKKRILNELKRTTGRQEEKILFLPAETDAVRVFEFYAAKFTERGFTIDANAPPQGENYQVNFWKNKGQTIAVAVIDAGTEADGKAVKILVVCFGIKTII